MPQPTSTKMVPNSPTPFILTHWQTSNILKNVVHRRRHPQKTGGPNRLAQTRGRRRVQATPARQHEASGTRTTPAGIEKPPTRNKRDIGTFGVQGPHRTDGAWPERATERERVETDATVVLQRHADHIPRSRQDVDYTIWCMRPRFRAGGTVKPMQSTSWRHGIRQFPAR